MANFTKFVTGIPLGPSVSASDSSMLRVGSHGSSPETKGGGSPVQFEPTDEDGKPSSASTSTGASVSKKQSLRRALSSRAAIAGRVLHRQFREPTQESSSEDLGISGDTNGSMSQRTTAGLEIISQDRYAGEPSVYEDIQDRTTFGIIRERVSTRGVVRPLEPESELVAFTVPEELIGTISELALRRYLDGEAHFRRKFAGTYKQIEKTRQKNLERAAKKEGKRFDALRASTSTGRDLGSRSNFRGLGSSGQDIRFRESVINSPGWGYAWALDELERPPPSSIVARRDTEEARKLALIADKAVMEDTNVNANSLWSVMMNSLAPLDRTNGDGKRREKEKGDEDDENKDREKTPTQGIFVKEKEKERAEVKRPKTFARLFSRHKSSP